MNRYLNIIKRRAAVGVLAGFIAIAAHAQEKAFTLTGTITGSDYPYVYLIYEDGKRSVQDSARIAADGSFEFHGVLEEPVIAVISNQSSGFSIDDLNFARLFIEPAKMQLRLTAGAFKDFQLFGSATQNEASELEALKADIRADMEPLTKAFDEAHALYREAVDANRSDAELEELKQHISDIREQFGPFNQRINRIDLAYIEQNPASYVSAYLLRFKASTVSLFELERLYANLVPKIRASAWGKEIALEIERIKSGSPGSVAPVFSGTDINGHPLSLEEFRGRYVLLDFWASWCVPCRKGNPHLLEIYRRYKGRGLEIIGISDDDSNPEAWRKAVAEDGIGVWRHILRGLKQTEKGFDRSADISDPYGIHTLPTKILIDPQGVIIGRYGGGGEDDTAMDRKLSEIFEM